MARDILQELVEMEVPEAPRDLRQDVHQRLNLRLTISQAGEFVASAIPFAVFGLLAALGGLFRYSLTGKYDDVQQRPHDD